MLTVEVVFSRVIYCKLSVVCFYVMNIIHIIVSKIVIMNVLCLLKHRSQTTWELTINDYTSREAGCVSEMLNKLQLHQLKTRRTNRHFTILYKAIYGHLSLPVNNLLQPVQRLSRHLNNSIQHYLHQ